MIRMNIHQGMAIKKASIPLIDLDAIKKIKSKNPSNEEAKKLMDRFNEYKNGFIKDALIEAMKNMGTVIISATIILGGTFGAMLPSGVLSLLQIATVVIIGLLLYAFVMLPLFTPVMIRFFCKYNWWPFKEQMKSEYTAIDS